MLASCSGFVVTALRVRDGDLALQMMDPGSIVNSMFSKGIKVALYRLYLLVEKFEKTRLLPGRKVNIEVQFFKPGGEGFFSNVSEKEGYV